jgi:ribose transport system permease protein
MPASTSKAYNAFTRFSRNYAIVFAILILGIIVSVLSPHFLTYTNIRNIFQQSTSISIVAIAQALVLLTGQFDLSLGQNVMVTSCTVAYLIKFGHINPWFAVCAGLLTGCIIGACNGFFIAYLRIPCFISTL